MEDLLLSNDLSRRVFVKGIGLISVGLILGAVGGCDLDKLLDAIAHRPVRRRLRVGSPEVDADIATYRQAVTLMKALPATDPRSWTNQAAIHGVATHFNFCEHGTDHFFDWHRAYLLYFERICQKLTGNAKFGLPYWNWNQNPDINPAFLDPTSVLFLARNRTSMTGSPSITTADLDPIFTDTNFFTFRSQIEGTPHNSVHSYIGGTMGGYSSALDPVFWTHHCMVDYCWAKWNIELGRSTTNDTTWVNTVDSHFVDADGIAATSTAGLTTIMPLLSYQYESSAIGSSPAAAAITTKSAYQKLEKRIRAGANIKFDVKQRIRVADKAAVSVVRPVASQTRVSAADFASIINSDASKERVFASVDYAQLPPASDFSVRVFVNLPAASRTTPTDDPHYAGSFAFFGTEQPTGTPGVAAHSAPKFLVNITPTLQRLKSTQQLADPSAISIQLVAVPFADKFEREDTRLLLNNIEILVTSVTIDSAAQ